MRGAWGILVTLSGSSFQDRSAIAQIVIDCIFLVAVTVAWFFLPKKPDSLWPAFYGIRNGGVVLILWYILNIVDLFLHEARLQAVYGYVLVYPFIEAFKVAADVCLLLGAHRVLACRLYGQLAIPIIWILVGEFLNIGLITMALYYLGSYVWNASMWLEVANPDLTDELSNRKDQFSIAFFAVQFVFTLFTLIGSLLSAWFWRKDSRHTPFPKEAYYAVAATTTLWTRSLSELILVLRFYLHGSPLSTSTFIARAFLYGFCTVGFLVLIAPVARDVSVVQPKDPAKQALEHDCHTYILNAVRDETDNGELPPRLRSVFPVMRANLNDVLSAQTKQLLQDGSGRLRMTPVLEHISMLEARYGDWQPLDRWRVY